MKGHTLKVRIAATCIAFVALLSISWQSWQRMTALDQYTLEIDSHLSSTTKAAITEFLAHELLATSHNFHATFAKLKQQFPCLHEVEAEIQKPGTVHYTLSALMPKIKINDTHILTNTGHVLTRSYFDEQLLNALQTMYVVNLAQGNSTAPYGLLTLTHALPLLFFTEHTITWVDEFEICAQRKDQPISLICNTDHVPDAALLERCNQIVASWPTPHPPLRVDVRFANQIVVHAEHRGTAHGQNNI